ALAGTEARPRGFLPPVPPGRRGGVPQLPPDRPGDASRMATPRGIGPASARDSGSRGVRKGAFACTLGLGGTARNGLFRPTALGTPSAPTLPSPLGVPVLPRVASSQLLRPVTRVSFGSESD